MLCQCSQKVSRMADRPFKHGVSLGPITKKKYAKRWEQNFKVLNQSSQTNLFFFFFTTNLFDKGCAVEVCEVFAIVSHDKLIKQEALRANKT